MIEMGNLDTDVGITLYFFNIRANDINKKTSNGYYINDDD